MSRFSLLLTSSLLAVVGACSTYSVRRAALVPHMQPIQRTAQPLGDTAVELGLGSPVVAALSEPTEAKDANAGIVLPRWQGNGALRVRLTRNLDIGFVYDHGLNSGARKVNDDMPFPENGNVYGYGTSLYFAGQVDPNFHIGVGAELLYYSIPYVEYRTCVDNCFGEPFTIVDESRDSIPVVSVGVTANRRINQRVSLIAGMNLRNHPTIEKGDVEGPEIIDWDEDVQEGPANIVAMGGVEVELAGGYRAMVYLHQPLFGDPVNYGPTLGIAVAIPLLGRRSQPTSSPPDPVSPPSGPPSTY